MCVSLIEVLAKKKNTHTQKASALWPWYRYSHGIANGRARFVTSTYFQYDNNDDDQCWKVEDKKKTRAICCCMRCETEGEGHRFVWRDVHR